MMPELVIHRVYNMFDWFAGGVLRCSSALCLLKKYYSWMYKKHWWYVYTRLKYLDSRFPSFIIPHYLAKVYNVHKNIMAGILSRSLMTGWRKNSWNHEKVSSVVTLSVCPSVCVCVRARATGHTFWPTNLIFGLSDPWNKRKKYSFSKFSFLRYL